MRVVAFRIHAWVKYRIDTDHSQDIDGFGFLHKMRIKKSTVNQTNDTSVLSMFVSESIQKTDDIWHFCGLFGSAPYCYHALTNMFGTSQNFEKRVKNLQNASKMVDFIGRALNGQILINIYPIFVVCLLIAYPILIIAGDELAKLGFKYEPTFFNL